MVKRELVIVGAGPAGMAAAISAHEKGVRDILVLERDQFLGGILNQCIHTGFGLDYFKELLSGPEYAERFIGMIDKINGNSLREGTVPIEISLQSFVVNITKDKVITMLKPGKMQEIQADAIIMATGCRERTREMAHIPGTRPSGIMPAGLAQKLINIEGYLPGKEVVIVGSGDIGLIMARRFTLEGAKVHAVVEIMQQTKGLVRNVVQCLDDFGIPLYLGHKISRIYGKDRVKKVDIVKVNENFNEILESKFSIDCDTVLISVGLIPENDLIEAAGAVIDKRTNAPVADVTNKTTIPGVFVCGNACKVYDLVDSVTKDSLLAGEMAAEYLGGNK